MTPTLIGRIQTRLFLVAIVGVIWTILIAPLLGGLISGPVSLGDVYRLAFGALVLVALVGVGWELLYHGMQQFRWEKDWPTLFGLVTGVPEGIVVYFLLSAAVPWDVGEIPVTAFLVHFVTTWLLIWLVANGPMRVVLIRWRFRGGRIL